MARTPTPHFRAPDAQALSRYERERFGTPLRNDESHQSRESVTLKLRDFIRSNILNIKGKRLFAAKSHGVTLVTLLALLSAPVAVAQSSPPESAAAGSSTECQAGPGEAHPWANKAYTPDCRARLALAEFRTLDEKLRFLSPPPAKEKSAVRDVAKVLGLPTITGSDGPA